MVSSWFLLSPGVLSLLFLNLFVENLENIFKRYSASLYLQDCSRNGTLLNKKLLHKVSWRAITTSHKSQSKFSSQVHVTYCDIM